MAHEPISRGRLAGMIVWTGAGVVTAVAALILMLGIFMIVLGAADQDPSEGMLGVILGIVGVAAWVALAVVAGLMLVKGTPGRRASLGVLPAAVSIAWCGLAAALLMGGLPGLLVPLGTGWPVSLGPLWVFVVVTLMTAGTIPVALALLVINIVLRLVRGRPVSA